MQSEDADHNEQPVREPLHRGSSSQRKPKGILKNANQVNPGPQQTLQWDEQNIALTEIQKDSLMKITEPKTPYVRYNPLTDEVEGEIPSLDLGVRSGSSSGFNASPTDMHFSGDDVPPDGSEHGSRRPSISGRSGSGSSSRSTSFSLPPETIGKEFRGAHDVGGEVEFEEEMDEEAAAKHAEFIKARGRHYSNEAEAMKKAAELLAQEDEVLEADGDDDEGSKDSNMEDDIPPVPPVPPLPRGVKKPNANGVV